MSGVISNMFPPKPTWSIDQIPDLTGQVMLVTGANTGIGKETAKVNHSNAARYGVSRLPQALLMHNAKVYLAGRNPQKVEEAAEDLQRETGNQALTLHLDLADLQSIKRAAEEFQRYTCVNPAVLLCR